MKSKYLCILYFLIFISLISFSKQNYKKSKLKKFLRYLGLPDVPLSNQFLDEEDNPSDTNPSDDTDYDNPEEKETKTEEEPDQGSESEEIPDQDGEYGENEDDEYKGENEDDEYKEENENDEPEEDKENDEPEEDKEDGEPEEDGENDEYDEEEDNPEEEEQTEEEKEKKTYVNIKCLYVAKYNVYTLQKLQNKNIDYEKEFENGKVIFNFCQDTNKNSSFKSTVLWDRNNTDPKLIRASGSIDGENKNKNGWAELNSDEDRKGLLITLAHGEECKNGKYHQTYLKLYCDSEIEDDDFLENVDLSEFYDQNNVCKHYIIANSIYACPLNDWYLLRRIMNKHKFLFGLGFMLIGLFLCMWGNKYKIPTIMIVMGLIFCYIISIIILNFIPSLINTEKKLWILLGVGFLIGTFVGYLIKAKITIFTIMLGISMGYSVAEIIYQFIQGFIEWNPTYLYYSTIGVCCIGGIVVGYYLIKTVMILGTSLVGGYVFMRGVAVIFGNYIDEGEYVDLIKSGEYEQLRDIKNGWVYLYLGIWLIMTVFGFYYQCIGHKKKESNSDEIEKKKKKKDEE